MTPSLRPIAGLSPKARTLRGACLAAASLVALTTVFAMAPARALERAETAAAPVLEIGLGDESRGRRIELGEGKSIIVELPRDAKEVFVANPKVANAIVRSTRKLFVIGQSIGNTSIFAMDAEGRQIAALEVNVGRDLNVLRATLRTAMPRSQVEVKSAGDSIVLTGLVDSAAEAQQAVDIANAFVGQTSSSSSSGGGGAGGGGVTISLGSTVTGKVINGITIRGRDQVMLKVTVAEVARTVLKQLGVDASGTWAGLRFSNNNPFPLQRQELSNSFSSIGKADFNATLRAFERAGVSRVLAEPTLTAVSGETANFTAGGQIPVPEGSSCTISIFGGQLCTTTFRQQKFGVTLTFTPMVLSENRISLRVATEVIELDYENQAQFANGINAPGLKVRKSETVVELPSGAIMMTAGLISQSSSQIVNGQPGVASIPILGALFRSRDYQRRETELMILVQPMVAKPMEAQEVRRPDDGFTDAHDAQTILLGRLNRLYGVAGSPSKPKSYRGKVGFIAD